MESKITFNGKEYSSIEEMSANEREKYEQLMKALDADGDGVPDLVQHGGILGKLMFKGVSKLLEKQGVGDLKIQTHRSGKNVRIQVLPEGSDGTAGNSANQHRVGSSVAQTIRPPDASAHHLTLNNSQNFEGGFSPLFKILVLLGLGFAAYYFLSQ